MKPIKKHKNTSLTRSSFIPRIWSFGNLEIDYMLELTSSDLEKYSITDLNNIHTLNDLTFLLNNKELWGRISLRTNNKSINTWLYLNKVSENKAYIEYVPFSFPVLNESENKFREMFESINDLNIFFLNKSQFNFGKYSMTITIKFNEDTKVIIIGAKDGDKGNQGKGNVSAIPKGKEGDSKVVQKDANEDSGNPFSHIKLLCKQYEYWFVNIEEATSFVPFDKFINYIAFIKVKYNSNIIIHFNDVTEYFKTKDEIILINKVYLLTDTFLISKPHAVINFNQHYQTFSTNTQNCPEIDDKNVFDYFISTIACGGELSWISSKIAFIIDDQFAKFTSAEVPSNGRAIMLDYDIKPHPKINHTNVDIVDSYKITLRSQRHFFEPVFYGGLLNYFIFSQNKTKSIEVIYPGYLTGHEEVRRILDLFVKDIPLPWNQKFYLVKLNQKEIDEHIKRHHELKKEKKFVLDCWNKDKSRMKYYVPLFDYNLHAYFGSSLVQNELKVKGFINNKGYVNYDPQYKMVMKGHVNKNLRTVESDKNIEVKKQIKIFHMPDKRILRSVSPTNRKLPMEKCVVMGQLKKLKCKHSSNNNKGKKCKYCWWSEKSIKEEEKEIMKKKKMQLRKYD